MSAAKAPGRIYNISAGTAFANCFAAQLIEETKGRPEVLTTYRVILPTRRAARILRDAFLDLTKGAPLLLPQMHALGDVDEEELSFSIAESDDAEDFIALPAALPPLRRQVLLATAIMKIPGYVQEFEQALLLARALGQLMDQTYTENLSLKNLAALTIPAELAAHWQITVKFMDVLSAAWDDILIAENAIDATDRRNKLLQRLAENWRKSPPKGPIIAAGTTGSIPATAALLRVIAALPEGRIVLPGLDQDMDETSWQELGESHPQYGLKHLLEEVLEVPRKNVLPWPGSRIEQGRPRRIMAAEIMRPPITTAHWTEGLPTDKAAQQSLKDATKGLNILTCANEREEAAAIAVLLRGALETEGRTAALITPRRGLARRVATACRRWGIILDDSAGRPLSETLVGSFFRLSADAATSDFTPVALLSLLKHPFSSVENVTLLDKELRGPRPPAGLKGIKQRDKAGVMRVTGPILDRFTAGSPPGKPRKFSEILEAHLEMAETLAGGSDPLWQREDGEAAAKFFAALTEQADLFPDVTITAYGDIISTLMEGIIVRPAFGTHPRLRILGQLEARMTDADLVIMAGLNEKTWPPEAAFDPWMSRPMRKAFGLPSFERRIGLAAHDFVQGFCAPKVVLTRSLRQDGAPTVPARWLQRLSAVLEAANIPEPQIHDAAHWANAMDASAAYEPVNRPEPRPPAAARPRKISVTNVEKWQKDPYGIYAKYILELRKMDELEEDVDAADKGTLLHKIMHRFTDEVPAAIPKDAKLILTRIAAEEIAARHDDPTIWSFWQRRFERTADWLVQHETGWRERATPAAMETEGEAEIAVRSGKFTLTAIADRIDTVPGGAAIIDYKSGNSFNKTEIGDGRRPQLPLEGLILAKGGFKETGKLTPVSLQYWKLTGSIKLDARPAQLSGDLTDLLEHAEESLITLVNIFDNENTPYYSLPRLDNRPKYNDYEHLARVKEWTALGDDESSEAA